MTKTEYNPKTGELGFEWNCSDGSLFDLNTNEDREFIDGALNKDTQYLDITVDPIEVKARPTFSATPDKTELRADGADTLTITGLPEGETKVSIFGPISTSWIEVRDEIAITVNIPGDYKVRFSQFPYIDNVVEFNAT